MWLNKITARTPEMVECYMIRHFAQADSQDSLDHSGHPDQTGNQNESKQRDDIEVLEETEVFPLGAEDFVDTTTWNIGGDSNEWTFRLGDNTTLIFYPAVNFKGKSLRVQGPGDFTAPFQVKSMRVDSSASTPQSSLSPLILITVVLILLALMLVRDDVPEKQHWATNPLLSGALIVVAFGAYHLWKLFMPVLARGNMLAYMPMLMSGFFSE